MMERTKRTTKLDVSRLKPINIEELSQSDDCFGKAWDPQHRSCSVCADVDICGVVFQDKVVIPKKDKFEESLPLDMTNFDAVNWDKMSLLVSKYLQDGAPLTYEELFELVQNTSKNKDTYITKLYIEKSLEPNGLKCDEAGNIVPNA